MIILKHVMFYGFIALYYKQTSSAKMTKALNLIEIRDLTCSYHDDTSVTMMITFYSALIVHLLP